jgi:hypothetical protein
MPDSEEANIGYRKLVSMPASETSTVARTMIDIPTKPWTLMGDESPVPVTASGRLRDRLASNAAMYGKASSLLKAV